MKTPAPDLELSLRDKTVRVSNVEKVGPWLLVLTFATTCVLSYAVFAHTREAEAQSALYVGVLKEFISVMRAQTIAQREYNCLQQFDERARPMKANHCREVTR